MSNKRSFVSYYKSLIAVLRLALTSTIKGGFYCDIVLLFYATALKFLTALIFNPD